MYFKYVLTGAAAARVQRVHLHPLISSNGCIAPVLMKNWPVSVSFIVQKGAFAVGKEPFWFKKCGTISNLGGVGHPFTLKQSYAPVLSGPWCRPWLTCSIFWCFDWVTFSSNLFSLTYEVLAMFSRLFSTNLIAWEVSRLPQIRLLSQVLTNSTFIDRAFHWILFSGCHDES